MNFGKQCENLAREFGIRQLKWNLMAQNWRFSRAEIDLIFQNKNQFVFVEVKGRNNENFGSGEELISQKKLRSLKSCIGAWLTQNDCKNWSLELWEINPQPIIKRFFICP